MPRKRYPPEQLRTDRGHMRARSDEWQRIAQAAGLDGCPPLAWLRDQGLRAADRRIARARPASGAAA